MLIHLCEGIDLERVWTTVERDLPEVRLGVESLLPPLDELARELVGDETPPADLAGEEPGQL